MLYRLKGDSGGPLVQFFDGYFKRAVLIGTVMGDKTIRGPEIFRLCGNTATSLWTNIDLAENINWILETIEKN